MNATAIEIDSVSHHYGSRQALNDLGLQIDTGQIFAILGPNGSGKTTLFRLLSTLIPLQSGRVEILGYDLSQHIAEIRRRIGIVFQAPSLDKKLTVQENLRCQAALYGLAGKSLVQREAEMLQRLGLEDRRHERAETLSGGLRRRVELAKGLLHRPQLVLLDEPSTGLDPGARSDLWKYLEQLRDEHQVTIVLTTHLLEEADKTDRLAIMNEGSVVALDTPDALRATVGGDSITIDTAEPAKLIAAISQQHNLVATQVDGKVRLEQADGHQWIARLVEAYPQWIQSITLGKPTLEDVFIEKTGHRFWHEEQE
jgi:ABC-2 type transport system ATP-binding protein